MSKKALKLTIKQRKAIDAMLVTKNNTEAAREAGISRQTLQRYLQEPQFKAEIERLRRESNLQTNARMTGAAAIAVETLSEVMMDSKNDIARVQAAAHVLGIIYKNLEHESITENRELKNELLKLEIEALKETKSEGSAQEVLKKYISGLSSE